MIIQRKNPWSRQKNEDEPPCIASGANKYFSTDLLRIPAPFLVSPASFLILFDIIFHVVLEWKVEVWHVK